MRQDVKCRAGYLFMICSSLFLSVIPLHSLYAIEVGCQKSSYNTDYLATIKPGQSLDMKCLPSDVDVENKTFSFSVEKTSEVKIMPKNSSLTLALLKNPYKGVAVCRVRDHTGQWWYVTRNYVGGLSYINEKSISLE